MPSRQANQAASANRPSASRTGNFTANPKENPTPCSPAELRETISGTSGIGPDQHRGTVRVARPRPEPLRDRGQRFGEYLDVIAGGARPRVPGSEFAGHGLTAGDLGAIGEHQQGMKAERPLPGGRRVLLPVGMIHADRGVHVQHDRFTGHRCPAGRPHRRPRRRPGRLHRRQVRGVDPLVQQPPRRRQRGDRAVLHLLINQAPDTGHAVGTVGDRRREIGEDPARVVHPRALVGVGQHRGDLLGQPRQVRDLPQQPHPGMGHHTDTIGRHPDPTHTPTTLATLHLESAFQLGRLRP